MAGILGIYGLIVAVILNQRIDKENYKYKDGYKHFASGLTCGLSCLVAAISIWITGDAGIDIGKNQ